MTRFPDIGLGILTWKAPETLRQTLESHRAVGLPDLVGERMVYVQEQQNDPQSVAIARDYGYRVEGGAENLGIFGGIDALIRRLHSPLVIFNENDFRATAPPDAVARELEAARGLILDNRADIVLLRSRAEPGAPFMGAQKTTAYHPGIGAPLPLRMKAAVRRLARPEKSRRMAARSIRTTPNAHQRFPRIVTALEPDWQMSTSRWVAWTNNPCLLRRSLFLQLLDRAASEPTSRRVNGRRNFEIELNSRWWRNQNFRIAQGPGIFTHDRIGYRGY